MRYFNLRSAETTNLKPNATGVGSLHQDEGQLKQHHIHLELWQDFKLVLSEEIHLWSYDVALNARGLYLVTAVRTTVLPVVPNWTLSGMCWDVDIESMGVVFGDVPSWATYFGEMNLMELSG